MELLATPTELRVYTTIESITDERATLLLGQASAAARSYCGWHIAPQITETVTVDGTGGPVQPLPTLYLSDVLDVTENGEAVTGYTWSAAGFLYRTGRFWTRTLRGVVANIVHGHEYPPPELGAVVCSIASRATVSPTGVVQEMTGPFQVTYSQTAPNQAGGVALLGAEEAILDRYRLPARQ